MKRIIFVLINCFFITAFSIAQHQKNVVFTSGAESYKNYRIPAIIALPNGSLLAFCEGRKDNAADYGDIDIVMKRSTDNGNTWSALKIIVDNENQQAGNCAPVVDLNDPAYPQGRIFLFYNTGNNTESEIRNGKGLREVWYKTSTDNGETWSNATNITAQVHRPKQPQVNAAYNFPEDWRSYANTPGHAIQFQHGTYKGRIYVAANHSSGNPQPNFTDYKAHGFYTDDHGKTFHLSNSVPVPGSNENMAVELSDNKLMLNMRNQSGNIKARIIAISSDGANTWGTTYFDKHLPDPVCQGSILAIGEKKKKTILAFCNAADTTARNNLTLRISYDEGKSWKESFVVDKSDDEKKRSDYTAYSDLVKLPNDELGILYERNDYKEIVFTKLKWK
jgi:sialidase-1